MATARIKNSQALVDNAWTLIFDSSVDGDARQVIVLNLSSSVNSIEVLDAPANRAALTTPDPAEVGFPIAPGDSTQCTGISASGGIVGKIWVRSAGANVAWKVGIR